VSVQDDLKPFFPDASNATWQRSVEDVEFAQWQDMGGRAKYLLQVAPYLADHPAALAEMVRMPMPVDELGYRAAALAGASSIDRLFNQIVNMSPANQRVVFSQLTKTQQAALAQMGFSPASDGDRGSNPLLAAGGAVVGAGMMGLNTLITKTPGLSEGLNVLYHVGDMPWKVYRGVRSMDDPAQILGAVGAIGAGIAAAPFTGGLSLITTGAVIGGAAIAGAAGGSLVGSATNPSDWWDSMSSSWDGERIFSRESQRRSAHMLGRDDNLHRLARDLAADVDLVEIAEFFASARDAHHEATLMYSMERWLDRVFGEEDSAQRREAAQSLGQVVTHPDFVDAVRELQLGKISVGRDIANVIGLQPGTQPYTWVSGATDALSLITLDPTLGLGRALSWNRAMRFGVPLLEDVGDVAARYEQVATIARMANENSRVGRAYDEIARAVEMESAQYLTQRVPVAKGMYGDLLEYKWIRQQNGHTAPFTRDDIFDWLKKGEGAKLMLQGHGVQRGYGRLMLPTYGWDVFGVHLEPRRLTRYVSAVIDFADDNNSLAHLRRVADEAEQGTRVTQTSIRPDQVLGARQGAFRITPEVSNPYERTRQFINILDSVPVVASLERKAGALLGSLKSMHPATRAIALEGPGSVEDIHRLAELGRVVGMSSDLRRQWMDHMLNQPNLALKHRAATSFIDTLLTVAGAKTTPDGAEMVAKYISKSQHRYGLGELDRVLHTGEVVRRGLMVSDIAYDLPMPDLRQLRQATEKGLLLKYAFRATDMNFVDALMTKVWKPLVLLRIGFITRAAGEEFLSLISRASLTGIGYDFGVRSVAEGKTFDILMAKARAKEFLSPNELEMLARYDIVAGFRGPHRIAASVGTREGRDALADRMAGVDWLQARAKARAHYAADVMPYERMMADYAYTAPWREHLVQWSTWIRGMLETGLAPDLAAKIPESRRLMVLGKEASVRRMLWQGVDPNDVRRAVEFQTKFASSVMRSVSARNANIWSTPEDARVGQSYTIPYKQPTGEITEMRFINDRSNFQSYTADSVGDALLDRMAHHQAYRQTVDPIAGQVHQNVTRRYAGGRAGINAEQVDALDGIVLGVKDRNVGEIMLELLDPSHQSWDGMLRTVSRSDADLGAYLRARHPAGNPDPQTLIEDLREYIHANWGPAPAKGKGKRMREALDQLDTLVIRMEGMAGETRQWMAQHLEDVYRNQRRVELIYDFDTYRDTFIEDYVRLATSPEHQQLLQGMDFAQALSDGTPVARPLVAGQHRTYVAAIGPEDFGSLVADITELGPEMSALVLKRAWREAQAVLPQGHLRAYNDIVDAFIDDLVGLGPARMRELLDQASGAGHGVVPLNLMAFDDPQVADAVSQFLHGVKARFDTAGSWTPARGLNDAADIDAAARAVSRGDAEATTYLRSQREEAASWQERIDFELNAITPRDVAAHRRVLVEEANEALYDAQGVLERIAPSYTRTDNQGNTRLVFKVPRSRMGTVDGRRVRVWAEGTYKGQPVGGEWDWWFSMKGSERQRISRTYFTEAGGSPNVNHMKPRGIEEMASAAGMTIDDFADELRSTIRLIDDARAAKKITSEQAEASLRTRLHDEMTMGLDVEDLAKLDTVFARADEIVDADLLTFHERVRDTNGHRGYVDFDDALRDRRPVEIDGVRRPMVERVTTPRSEAIEATGWRLDIDTTMRRTHVLGSDTPIRQMPDGQWQVGVTLEDAIFENADKMFKQWLYTSTGGAKRDYVTKTPLYRRPDGKMQIDTGTKLQPNQKVYDQYGNTVSITDETFIETIDRVDAVTDLEWNLIGPMMRDAGDHFNGTVRRLADDTNIAPLSEMAQELRFDQAPGVRQFRSTYTDVSKMNERPQVAIGPLMIPERIPSKFEAFVQWGFERVVSPSIDAIIRKPAAFHYFNEAMKDNERAIRWFLDEGLMNTALPQAFKPLAEAAAIGTVSNADIAARVRSAARVLDPDMAPVLARMDDTDVLNYLGRQAFDSEVYSGGLLEFADQHERAVGDILTRAVDQRAGTRAVDAHVGRIGTKADRDAAAEWVMDNVMYRGTSLRQWYTSIDDIRVLARDEAWSVPLRTAQTPGEGLVSLYRQALGDEVLRQPFHIARRAFEDLPPQLSGVLTPESWRTLQAGDRNLRHIENLAGELAVERTIQNVVPFLDSHEIRSQFGEYAKGFLPFWYAEENFLKRWARTIKIAPATIRKAQLLYSGLKSGGVVRTDSQGRDWFVYPGSAAATEMLGKLPFLGEVLPAGMVFATETRNMLPGFDVERTGAPSVNPLVALSLGPISSMFHELRPVQKALVGEVGISQSGVSQFVPTSIRRFYDAVSIGSAEEPTRKVGSAMMSTLQILEAYGHIPDTMTPDQQDELLRDVRNSTRTMLIAQAVTGFIVPGAPVMQFTGESATSLSNLTGTNVASPADIFRTEFLTLINEMGIEEGTQAYIGKYPGGDLEDLVQPMAFAVGQSYSSSGAPLPATAEAVAFYDEHNGFLSQYQSAGAWLLPPGDGHDSYAYTQQAISGLRKRRTPKEFLRAMKFREGSIKYFPARKGFEDMQAKLIANGHEHDARMLGQEWEAWRLQFLAMHPVFAQELQGSDSRQRRQNTINEIRTALQDPALPRLPHGEGIRALAGLYDHYKLVLSQLSESRTVEAQERVAAWKQYYSDLVDRVLVEYPSVEAMWLTVYRPEAQLD
jgi:hypothetical protein